MRWDPRGSPFPTYFAMVMATGVVSTVARNLGFTVIGWALFGWNMLLFLPLWTAGALRLAKEPAALLHELGQHRTGPQFFTVVAGTAVFGNQFAVFGLATWILPGLFAATVVLWIITTYGFLVGITKGRSKPDVEHGLSGAWLLLVVATASLAVLGSDLVADGSPSALGFFCYASSLLAGLYYLLIAAVILYRFAFRPMLSSEIIGPWWINEGAAAITVLAFCKLMRINGLRFGDFSARDLIAPLTTIFWIDATFWIPLLVVLFAWKHLMRHRKVLYDVGLWSVVFPIGMYAAATLQFQAAFNLPFLWPLPHVFFWIALVGWGLAILGTSRRLVRNMIA